MYYRLEGKAMTFEKDQMAAEEPRTAAASFRRNFAVINQTIKARATERLHDDADDGDHREAKTIKKKRQLPTSSHPKMLNLLLEIPMHMKAM